MSYRYPVPEAEAFSEAEEQLASIRVELKQLKKLWDVAALVDSYMQIWKQQTWDDVDRDQLDRGCRRLLRYAMRNSVCWLWAD